MKTVILETWTEIEAGWGQKSDGASLHLTKEDYKSFVSAHHAEETKRNPSGKVPSIYERPDDNLSVVYVSDELYKQISKNKKKFGIRIYEDTLLKYLKESKIKKII